jgi:hypothetical protein
MCQRRIVIASEAKQPKATPKTLDCFVATLVAMTLGDVVRVTGNDDAGETGPVPSSLVWAIPSIECTVTLIPKTT